jgi:hypothetical protein
MYGFQDVLDAHDFLTCDKRNKRGYSITRQVAVVIGPEQAGEEITITSDIAPTVLVRGHIKTWVRQVTLINLDKTMLTLAEASEKYGINRETLRRRCASGQIKDAIKRGSAWLVSKAFFDAQVSTARDLQRRQSKK